MYNFFKVQTYRKIVQYKESPYKNPQSVMDTDCPSVNTSPPLLRHPFSLPLCTYFYPNPFRTTWEPVADMMSPFPLSTAQCSSLNKDVLLYNHRTTAQDRKSTGAQHCHPSHRPHLYFAICLKNVLFFFLGPGLQ